MTTPNGPHNPTGVAQPLDNSFLEFEAYLQGSYEHFPPLSAIEQRTDHSEAKSQLTDAIPPTWPVGSWDALMQGAV